jgi:putative cardiolipin synthase
MYNKLFVTDDALVLSSSPNMAKVYFEIHPGIEFSDLNLLAVNHVVSEDANTFDDFWNSTQAVPIQVFKVAVDPQELYAWQDLIFNFQ